MANKKNTSKKPKKEIKDSVDITDIKASEPEVETTSGNEDKNSELKIQKPFKERYADFVTNHKIPIVSFCYKLINIDFKKYKEDPYGLSADTFFLKEATNKKRFILRIVYLISLILLGISLLALGIAFATGVIPLEGLGTNGSSLMAGITMAIGVVILGCFI